MFDPFLIRKNITFTAVSRKEDSEALLSSTSSASLPLEPRPRRWGFPLCLVISLWVVMVSLIVNVVLMWAGFRWVPDPYAFCIRHTSQYCKHQSRNTTASLTIEGPLTSLQHR